MKETLMMPQSPGKLRRAGLTLLPLVMLVMLVMAPGLIGCGGSSDSTSTAGSGDTSDPGTDPTPKACGPGELTLADGSCQRAGLPPDMPCPPGELPLQDGKCQKAGVPPSACGAGFTPDGKDGCEPILPADPCPDGQMAVPGDTECHDVAPCGSGTWGDIPVEANTQFVDQAYAGGDSNGTKEKPWLTIQQGIKAAAKGAIVAVAAGSYPEDVTMALKPVRLWGRCPKMVEVTGAGVEDGAIQVLYKPASGAEVRGIATTGAQMGIVVRGAKDVVIEKVWVHDTEDDGLYFDHDPAGASVALKGSLIEKSYNLGLGIFDADVTLEDTVVRSTRPDAQGGGGWGIFVQDVYSKVLTQVTFHGCVVEQNHEIGIFVSGLDATIEATVVRSTVPGAPGGHAQGIFIEDEAATNMRSNVTVRACVVEQNQSLGILVAGSDVTLDACVIRSTLSDGTEQGAHGISVFDDPDTGERSNVTVHASVVEENYHGGMMVAGSDAMIEATIIRSTLPDAKGLGIGLVIMDNAHTGARSNVTVHACLVEQNASMDVFVFNSDASFEATAIRSTLPDATVGVGIGLGILDQLGSKPPNVSIRSCTIEQNQGFGVIVYGSDATIETTEVSSNLTGAKEAGGYGIVISDNPSSKARADVKVFGSLVDQNYEAGIYLTGSDATIKDTVVSRTAWRSDKFFGDGISVIEGSLALENAKVTGNDRGGVVTFGGDVRIAGGAFTCNATDLDWETSHNIDGSFDGSAGHQCSLLPPHECSEIGVCNARSNNMEPPSPPPPLAPLKP